jgi:hypothetical protein
MAGRVIYSYPIFRAIQEGYVKRLKAVQLNPRTLRYVRREDDQEIEVSLDEVRRLGEDDADFRRSIVTSQETLNTIVDASIRELDRLRTATGDNRLKIIASALNYRHCQQIVEAYRARGRQQPGGGAAGPDRDRQIDWRPHQLLARGYAGGRGAGNHGRRDHGDEFEEPECPTDRRGKCGGGSAKPGGGDGQ